MKRITGIKHLLLMLVALVCAGNAWAETKTFTLSYSDMTLTAYSASDDGYSHLTGKSGTKAEGCELILMKNGKEWSSASSVTVGSSSLTSIKVSNGAQNKCILPDGWKATKVTFYSYVNGTDLGTSYWKEVGGVAYTAETTKTFKSAKDGANPDVVSFDLDNVTEFTFTNTGKQVCFAAVVEATDGGLEYNIEVVSAPENAGVVEVAQSALDETQVSVKLTATPNVGHYFQKWVSADGEVLSTENPYSYTATSDAAIKAVFGYCEKSPIANAGKDVAIAGTSYTIDGTYNPSGTGSNYGSMLKQASVKLRTNQAGNTLTFGVNEGWKITGITLAGYANDAGTISVTSASVDGVAVENFATVTFPANTENKSAEVKLENISALESVTLNFDNSAVVKTSQIYATYTVYYEKSGLYNIDVTCDPEEGGFIQRTQNTRADGVTDEITLTATANKHYTFQGWKDAEGNTLSTENPYSFTTTADKSIVAVFEEDVKYSVSFLKDESVEGQVPDAVSNYVGETVTVPANFWLYKEGYTLTGWTDGETTYAAGQKITITEKDVTLTPIFRANTVSLAERTAAVTIRWIFGREEGAPIVAWEGSKYPDMTWVTQADVNGETIDVKLGVDASSGKMNNASRTDKLCQVNGGTKYYVPVCDGAIIRMEANGVITATTIAGEAIGGESKTPSYTYNGSDEEVEIVINDGSYYRYIEVVLPANILLVEDGKALSATGSFESATYTRKFNTTYNYGTICLPFAPDAATCANYHFYTLASETANALVFEEVTEPKANTAYLYTLKSGVGAETAKTFTGGATTVSAIVTEPVGNWAFAGVFANTEITSDGSYYVYAPDKGNGEVLSSVKTGFKLTVKPYRAYFQYTGLVAQSLASMRIVVRGAGDNGDGTTGIEEVITPDQIEGAAPAIYNLMGQPVAQPVKGQIYIVNGKKVVY